MNSRPFKKINQAYITPAEYARRNYITPKTAYNHIRSGKAQGIEIGGRQFIKVN